ncbi:ribonuclease e/g [Lucifera butyrica]|uniref:Ribonuclease G n=1 Tax=Lucifera butyrica TaxID=1351585 RepID=A0A498R8N4_9FIRM|nr:Rne/Rng family ribonuclease [Lucifera butyrica]VBB07874.1 ribonuclease e/g [Lucifera butyrica]
MGKTILINVTPEETRMALLENSDLVEVAVERAETGHIVGNIYKGRIKNVLPGMQAAFIDIGRDKNSFLYVGDLFPRVSRLAAGDEVLTAGQDIIIQIVKDAIGTKGPRATTHLTLPGRYVVLMPTVDYIGISRRIECDKERERLKAVAEKVRPAGMGMIVRTIAEGKTEDDLQRDVSYLHNLWNALTARSKRSHAPTLLYRDVDLVIRIVRDYLTADVSEMVIDNREAYGRVCDLLRFTSPDFVPRVRFYQGTDDLFVHYGIDGEMEKLHQRQVWLKCGGYLVIDHTEALTVIDVNTGKFVGQTNLADTVFQTNLQAVAEIARQIRLRDIGGIIIIDFIDMEKDVHKEAVLTALGDHLKKDRTKTNVLGLTGLGLVEMTRKKSRQNLDSLLYSECPCCSGRGRIQSPETVAIHVRRHLRKINGECKGGGHILIQVHPRVAEIFSRQDEIPRLEQELARRLVVEAVPTMHTEAFSVLYQQD